MQLSAIMTSLVLLPLLAYTTNAAGPDLNRQIANCCPGQSDVTLDRMNRYWSPYASDALVQKLGGQVETKYPGKCSIVLYPFWKMSGWITVEATASSPKHYTASGLMCNTDADCCDASLGTVTTVTYHIDDTTWASCTGDACPHS